jgi:uracil phosphoribosyltransferase
MPETTPGPMVGRPQPSRASFAADPRLTIVQHPLADDLMRTVRDRRSDPRAFGVALEQLALFLLWEVSRDLPTVSLTVPGFDHSSVEVLGVESPPAGVVIMRAGSIFDTPFRMLFPQSPLYHLGVSRDEATLSHHIYSDNLALTPGLDLLLILDPMLATGGTIKVAVERARTMYSGEIRVLSVVAAPVGVQSALASDSRLKIVTAALDEDLNDSGFIRPGLGDAGDRLFGTTGS